MGSKQSTTVKVGGVTVAKGDHTKACFTGPDCTGDKVLATEGIGHDFWKACQGNGHKSLGFRMTWGDNTKAFCYNVNSSGEVELHKQVLWDSVLGGVTIERGTATKACFTGPNCTGSKVLETNGVGSDFWKACQASGHQSVAVHVPKPWDNGDRSEAKCYNISTADGSTGEVDANRTLEWIYPGYWDSALGWIEVDRGNDTMACFKGPECTGEKVYATEFVGDNFWKACNYNNEYKSMAVRQTWAGGDSTQANCFSVTSSGKVDINKTVPWEYKVGGVEISRGNDTKACWSKENCTGEKFFETSGVGADFFKVCHANGYPTVATQLKTDGTKAKCSQIIYNGEEERDLETTVSWEPPRVDVGGVSVLKGDYNKICYMDSDCTGESGLQTLGVGNDFWKACQANGYKSAAVQQAWWAGDYFKADCFNVNSSGEVNANKIVDWVDPIDPDVDYGELYGYANELEEAQEATEALANNAEAFEGDLQLECEDEGADTAEWALALAADSEAADAL